MMFLFEDELDDYLDKTAVYPHPSKDGKGKSSDVPQKSQDTRDEEVKRSRKISNLTSRGIFPETAAQKQIEKLLARERD